MVCTLYNCNYQDSTLFIRVSRIYIRFSDETVPHNYQNRGQPSTRIQNSIVCYEKLKERAMNNTVIADLKELTKLLIADKISDTHQAAATPNTTSEKWLFSFTLSFVVAISALFLLITISILGIVLCAIRLMQPPQDMNLLIFSKLIELSSSNSQQTPRKREPAEEGFQPLISKTNSNDLELSQVHDGGDGMSVSSCDRTDSFTSTAITCQYCGKVATNGLDSPNKGQIPKQSTEEPNNICINIKNKMKNHLQQDSPNSLCVTEKYEHETHWQEIPFLQQLTRNSN
ncbi:hypothetical protein EB796_021223 [Bugula neritina]|uniref:Uncharacterized protein n=1 Tax=Bugula neritina TaxID=10212 RepID=A0A7J7J3Q7_BUGNE|nr:hypothetical protein EB796_021223 [Bugula neritina]